MNRLVVFQTLELFFLFFPSQCHRITWAIISWGERVPRSIHKEVWSVLRQMARWRFDSSRTSRQPLRIFHQDMPRAKSYKPSKDRLGAPVELTPVRVSDPFPAPDQAITTTGDTRTDSNTSPYQFDTGDVDITSRKVQKKSMQRFQRGHRLRQRTERTTRSREESYPDLQCRGCWPSF